MHENTHTLDSAHSHKKNAVPVARAAHSIQHTCAYLLSSYNSAPGWEEKPTSTYPQGTEHRQGTEHMEEKHILRHTIPCPMPQSCLASRGPRPAPLRQEVAGLASSYVCTYALVPLRARVFPCLNRNPRLLWPREDARLHCRRQLRHARYPAWRAISWAAPPLYARPDPVPTPRNRLVPRAEPRHSPITSFPPGTRPSRRDKAGSRQRMCAAPSHHLHICLDRLEDSVFCASRAHCSPRAQGVLLHYSRAFGRVVTI